MTSPPRDFFSPPIFIDFLKLESILNNSQNLLFLWLMFCVPFTFFVFCLIFGNDLEKYLVINFSSTFFLKCNMTILGILNREILPFKHMHLWKTKTLFGPLGHENQKIKNPLKIYFLGIIEDVDYEFEVKNAKFR